MSLLEVQHQGFAQRIVRRAVTRDRVPHAYLFHGPDGVGKELFARGLAQLLLCESAVDHKIDPSAASAVGATDIRAGCGRCSDCRLTAAGTHPDLHVIYRQLNRDHPDADVRKRKALDIGVDVMRHFVINKVGLTPHRGRAKVFVIREADRITTQAQNALLKTLEEPPGTTYLVLLVELLDLLLPTTLSRCQTVRFDALPAAFVFEKLTELRPKLDESSRRWYARAAEGSMGRALEWEGDDIIAVNGRIAPALSNLMQPENENADPEALGKLLADESAALAGRFRKRDPDISDTEAGRRGLQRLFVLLSNLLSEALREQSGFEAAPGKSPFTALLDKAGVRITRRRFIAGIQRLALAERQLDLNANTQLVVETLVNDLSHLPAGATPAAYTR